MSAAQNLAYSVVQVAHNFGAVAAVGGSFAALKFRAADDRRRFAWLVIAGLATQTVSGAAFGAVSYFYYHHFPDISGIAVEALTMKMACVAAGFLLMAVYLWRSREWEATAVNLAWVAMSLLTSAALFSAAFLRWFS